MTNDAIYFKLQKAIERTGIKSTITPHCFRRTRATIMFTQKSKDGGLIYTDKEIALHFGWSIKSVPLRRAEYDLTNQEDLRKKVFGNGKKAPSYDVIKAEKDKLEIQYGTKIKELEYKIQDMINKRDKEIQDAELQAKLDKEHTKKFAKEHPEKYEKVLELVKTLKDLGLKVA